MIRAYGSQRMFKKFQLLFSVNSEEIHKYTKMVDFSQITIVQKYDSPSLARQAI